MTEGINKFWKDKTMEGHTERMLSVANHAVRKAKFFKPEVVYTLNNVWNSNRWTHIELNCDGHKVVVTLVKDSDAALIRWNNDGNRHYIAVDLTDYPE